VKRNQSRKELTPEHFGGQGTRTARTKVLKQERKEAEEKKGEKALSQFIQSG
jgi:hypothetical protein